MKAWCRLWNEFATDPKWAGITQDARARLPWWLRLFSRLRQTDVKDLWTSLMTFANQVGAGDDGSIAGFSVSDWAASNRVPQIEARAIFNELEHRGMIADDKLTAWVRRNPAREDPTSTERGRRHRAKAAETLASPAQLAFDLATSISAHCQDLAESARGPRECLAETHVKRNETHQTQSETKTQNLPIAPSAVALVNSFATAANGKKRLGLKDGTRAGARAGSALSDAKRKELVRERWMHRILERAVQEMPPERYLQFTTELANKHPARWVFVECERLDSQIKAIKARRCASAAKSARRRREPELSEAA